MLIDFKDKYEDITRQNNITVLVGNGFDISVLSKYREDSLTTSYSKFFDYIEYKGVNKDNQIANWMRDKRDSGDKNWSDLERTIESMTRVPFIDINNIEKDLEEIQFLFLEFLNEVVNPEILIKLNKDAMTYGWSNTSLSKFLADFPDNEVRNMDWLDASQCYQMYNFNFINFNYTFLLDNYINLDRKQFEPHPHKGVDRNFWFYPFPNEDLSNPSYTETKLSSYVNVDIMHPHGVQSIPRSILFGFEDQFNNNPKIKPFIKSYWAQNDLKYKDLLDKTNLFIIFGTSISSTDSWWWNEIIDNISKEDSKTDILIYYFDKSLTMNKDAIIEKFGGACDRPLKINEVNALKKKIHLCVYDDPTKIKFLGLNQTK